MVIIHGHTVYLSGELFSWETEKDHEKNVFVVQF